jgi:hypothetical protein
MFAVSTTSQSTSSIATKILSTVTLMMLVGVQGAHAASQRRVFIGTAAMPQKEAIQRCTNIAAQVHEAAPVVSVNYLGLMQCELATDTVLTDEQFRRFGQSFTGV